MSALHLPLSSAINEHMAAVEAAAKLGDADSAIFRLLDVFATLGRDAAQKAWLAHHDDEDRDDRMDEVENELVFQSLKSSWSRLYPELPGQIESVLREAFGDEHFRLEDPLGWAEINDESQGSTEALP